MPKRVLITREAVEGMLGYCADMHPREGILLLRGKVKKDEIVISELLLPPMPVQSEAYSSFTLSMLPLDISIVGVAHSHPSGILEPSEEDLNQIYGRLMIIVGPPYESEEQIAVFDKDGNRAKFTVIYE